MIMKEKEQSSIEWLIQHIKMLGEACYDSNESIDILNDKAKELHKNEILDTYKDGRSDQQSDKKDRFYNRTSIGYYNEKYK